MFAVLSLLLSTPSQAVEIEVRHLGLVATYDVTPGETLTEAWSDVVFPAQHTAERRRDRRPSDVHLVLDVVETDEEQLVVKVDLQRTVRGREVYRTRPTLVTDRARPAVFVDGVERAVEAVSGEAEVPHVRWVEQPVTEVRVLPEGR